MGWDKEGKWGCAMGRLVRRKERREEREREERYGGGERGGNLGSERVEKRGGEETHRKQRGFHPRAPSGITLQPPLRPPDTRIRPKDLFIAMHHPRTHAYHRPAAQPPSAHRGALGGHDAFEW